MKHFDFCIFSNVQQSTHIKNKLAQLGPELVQKYHVQSIGLFGPVVRIDFTSKSDIDIIVDFSKPISIEFVDLANYIEQQLRQKVDLVSKKGIHEKYFKAIEKDIVYV